MSGYLKNDLTADARSHLLGAITSAYASHDAMQADNQKLALVELDKLIILAREARKCLLEPPKPQPVVAEPKQCLLTDPGCEACQ